MKYDAKIFMKSNGVTISHGGIDLTSEQIETASWIDVTWVHIHVPDGGTVIIAAADISFIELKRCGEPA